MRVNAMTEQFEDVTVLGHPMIFTCLRVDRDTVPEGLYVYEVRHDDDQQGDPVQIGNWIMVNHWGTIISNKPIRLEPSPNRNNAYRDIDPEEDWNYEGTVTTVKEYMEKHPPVLQNHIGKEKAIHSKELEKLFMLDGRNIRRKISALRQDGFPICSDETGYYYADNQKEINHTVCRLNELVTKVSNARTGLLFASVLGEKEQTIEVTIKVK